VAKRPRKPSPAEVAAAAKVGTSAELSRWIDQMQDGLSMAIVTRRWTDDNLKAMLARLEALEARVAGMEDEMVGWDHIADIEGDVQELRQQAEAAQADPDA
jgi:hypothetical protein